MAVLLRADGTVVHGIRPKNGTDFQFSGEAYDMVGTDVIEIVATIDGRLMLLDEEGKLKQKPVNYAATSLYPHGGIDPIVGDVLVCDPSEIK